MINTWNCKYGKVYNVTQEVKHIEVSAEKNKNKSEEKLKEKLDFDYIFNVGWTKTNYGKRVSNKVSKRVDWMVFMIFRVTLSITFLSI